jgi:hypothetical protein
VDIDLTRVIGLLDGVEFDDRFEGHAGIDR